MALALLAFPLFLSVDLDRFSPTLDTVINAWKLLSLAICVFLYLNRLLGKKRAAAHIWPMILVLLALLLSTIVNLGSFETYFIVWGGFFAVCLLVDANIRERPLQLFLALKIALGAIAMLNFTTVVLRPGGLWYTATEGFWLLGHRNNFGTPLIAAIVVSTAYDLLARRRLSVSTLVISAVSFGSVAITWSASSVVTVVLAIAAVLLVALSKTGLRWLRPFVLLTAYVAIDLGIVLFQVQERASEFIARVLDRSADLTGRTRIWDIAFEMIRESPVWGNGVQLAQNNGLTYFDPNFVHAHNGELDILMQGGLLAFVPFVVMILLATRNANRYYQRRAVQILYLGLILVMLRAITGLFFSSYAVLLVFLILNSDTIARLADAASRTPFDIDERQVLR
ncbi:O-antigen ligase family protein [Microbacterium sp.]|uniref:O-antigen ligase family protein n=1 Tax=Microbacterium sp. TaxID=51671 RepID=UPI003F97BE23